MKRVVLLVALMLICATASQAYMELVSGGGSMGWYREISSIPGMTYCIDAIWQGEAEATCSWCEVMLFNDDGRPIYEQIDAWDDGSIVAKVDSWGTNGGMPFDWAPISDFYYPAGTRSHMVTATGERMYLALRNGAIGGTSICRFDKIYLSWDRLDTSEDGWVRWAANEPWGDPSTFEYNVVVPEPTSVMALLTGLVGLGGLALRRRK